MSLLGFLRKQKQLVRSSRIGDELRGGISLSIRSKSTSERGGSALEYVMVLSITLTFLPACISALPLDRAFNINPTKRMVDGGTEGKNDPTVGKQVKPSTPSAGPGTYGEEPLPSNGRP